MLEGGQIVHRHQDHVRKRMVASEELSVPSLDISPESPQTKPETENNIENESQIPIRNNQRVGGDILLVHVKLLIDMNRT